MRKSITGYFAAVLIVSIIFTFGCSGERIGSPDESRPSSGGSISLQGAGASFPKPIYEKWMSEYGKLNPNIRIDYQSVGSGAGQKAIISNTADFGASDDPMKDEDLSKAERELIHIPTVLGAVVLTYNLEGVDKPLKLAPEVISSIYMGEIKKWNDVRLKADNPDAALPDAEITPVYRADSSGTTAVFTAFLAKTNEAFQQRVTSGKQPNWVTGVGIGAKGNDGVMGQVKQTPNTIGYVEVAFAKENKLPVALIKNKAGKFVEPSIGNISSAAAGAIKEMPEDMRIDITNPDGDEAYPISSYTYILVYKDQKNAAKGKALIDFLWWAIHDGSKYAADLHYAPLPAEVVSKVEAKINSISADGKPLREASNALGK